MKFSGNHTMPKVFGVLTVLVPPGLWRADKISLESSFYGGCCLGPCDLQLLYFQTPTRKEVLSINHTAQALGTVRSLTN